MIVAYTGRQTRVTVSFVEDVEPNKGGYYCEVELNKDPYRDNFCIHPYDCNCKNFAEVEDTARDIISQITEY